MWRELRAAAVLLMFFTVVTGLLYPAALTAISQVLFPELASGSIIYIDGRAVGSELIGQQFNGPEYFWSRPSATAPVPYNADVSEGSNLGPNNPALAAAVDARVGALRTAYPSNRAAVPSDLVTASGSGLDPHISPAAAYYQAPRVARVRGLPENEVRELILLYTDDRQFGILGEPRVNVLLLNLALDRHP
jgi:K+-transporting ATPase ATPase C chain